MPGLSRSGQLTTMSSSSFRCVTSVQVKEHVSTFQPARLHRDISLGVIVLRALPLVFLNSFGCPSVSGLTSYHKSHTRGCPCILLDTYVAHLHTTFLSFTHLARCQLAYSTVH